MVSEQRKTKERHGTGFSVLAVLRMERQPKNEGEEVEGKEGQPPPALLLAPFFACSLTLVPRSLLRNRTEMLATQATCLCIAECPAAVSNACDGH